LGKDGSESIDDVQCACNTKTKNDHLDSIMAAIAKPSDDANINTHVRQKPHELPSGYPEFFLCRPGCVFKGLLDILMFKIRES
jgi:hypothetical protein